MIPSIPFRRVWTDKMTGHVMRVENWRPAEMEIYVARLAEIENMMPHGKYYVRLEYQFTEPQVSERPKREVKAKHEAPDPLEVKIGRVVRLFDKKKKRMLDDYFGDVDEPICEESAYYRVAIDGEQWRQALWWNYPRVAYTEARRWGLGLFGCPPKYEHILRPLP